MDEPAVRPVSPERVAAELEIRNVLARLAQLADLGDTDAYLQLLTDDIVWAMPPNLANGLPASERRGHDEIGTGQRERIASGLQGPGTNTKHVVTTSWVEVQTDDVAVAYSYFQFWVETATNPLLQNMGRYEDEFRRTAKGWQLARRAISFG
jgi:3-phenylpropionate/cinnamic acid dioxygenase small subunit